MKKESHGHCVWRALPRLILLGAATLSLAACAGVSPPARFYILQPVIVEAQASAAADCFALGVGPVTLPGYLDREQMVARKGDNSVQVAEYDRWAEPLDKAFARTLAAHLEQQICARPVVSYPFPQGVLPDLQVSVQLNRHDCMAGGECVLEASWVVLDRRGDIQTAGSGRLSKPMPDDSFQAMAATLSQLNALLAKDVAHSLRQARQIP